MSVSHIYVTRVCVCVGVYSATRKMSNDPIQPYLIVYHVLRLLYYECNTTNNIVCFIGDRPEKERKQNRNKFDQPPRARDRDV